MGHCGRFVYDLDSLARAAQEKRAVVVPSKWHLAPMPAAFVLSMPGVVILRLLKAGMWLYEKTPKEN